MKINLLLGACAVVAAAPLAAAPADLLAPWTGPYGGEPNFGAVRVADFAPALEAGMADERREIAAIADNPAPPTFANTIVALETAGAALNRVQNIFGIWSSNLKTPDVAAVETAMAPKLAAFGDTITQNPKLFARIDAVYNSPAKAALTPEQARLVWVYWTRFVQQGAKLSPADKATFAANNEKLASLYTKFAQNELADEENYVLVLDSPAQLKGLTKAQVDAAAAEGVKRGQPGKWLIANTRSAMEPFLTYADEPREPREGLPHVDDARRQRRRDRQQRGRHADSRAARGEREADRLSDLRALGAVGPHGEDAGERDGARTRRVAARRRAGPPRRRRHAGGDRRRGEGRRPAVVRPRPVGLSLLRREGPQGEVRPRPQRGEAVPPARPRPRRDVLRGEPGLRLHLHEGRRPQHLPSRRDGLRGHGPRRPSRRPVVLRSLRPPPARTRGRG